MRKVRMHDVHQRVHAHRIYMCLNENSHSVIFIYLPHQRESILLYTAPKQIAFLFCHKIPMNYFRNSKYSSTDDK